MTQVTISMLMLFHCNQKAPAKTPTISMTVLLPSRAALGSAVFPSWRVTHSNRHKSLLYVVWSVFIDVSVHCWKCTWWIWREKSMCSTEIRTDRVWFWFIHSAILNAAAIDSIPQVSDLLCAARLVCDLQMNLFHLVLCAPVTLLCYLKKPSTKSMPFVNYKKETPNLQPKAALRRLRWPV